MSIALAVLDLVFGVACVIGGILSLRVDHVQMVPHA